MNKEINKIIKISLNHKELKNLLLTNESFNSLINSFINVLELEAKKSQNEDLIKNAEELKVEFINITGNFDWTKIYKDQEEIEDNLKYFNVFVKNTLNKTYSELENELTHGGNKASNNTENNIQQNEDNTRFSNNQNKQNKAFNPEDYINSTGTNVDQIAEMMVLEQANLLLQKRIATGQVFIYKNKPKIIPIIKIIISCLFFLLLVSISGTTFTLFYLNGKIDFQVTNASSGQQQTLYYNFIAPFPLSFILTTIINIMILYSMIKNFKNDNVKYFINYFMPLIYLIILLITDLAFESKTIIFQLDSLQAEFIKNHSTNYLTYWDKILLARGFTIASITIILLNICLFIVSIFYNPKKDFERISLLIQDYARQIKNGEIPQSEFKTSFGSRFGNGIF